MIYNSGGCNIIDHMQASINTTVVRILLGTALVVQAGTVLQYASYFKQLNVSVFTTVVIAPTINTEHCYVHYRKYLVPDFLIKL